MAAPPIVIGPFTNVPAPGSPIRSDWPQQASNIITDLLTRRGCALSHPGQAIASGATGQIAWSVENQDTDNFHAANSPSIIIPTGLGASYGITAWASAGAGVSGMCDVTLLTTAGNLMAFIPAAKTGVTVSASLPLAAGNTVALQIYNAHTASLNFAAGIWLYRLGP